MSHLTGKKVAFLMTNGFEDSEFTSPWEAVTEHGAQAELISPETGTLTGKNGHQATPDKAVADANADDYDALVLPGGVANGDKLRMNEDAVRFVRAFFDAGKPVAAICHGPWMLVEADVARDRTVTSYPSLRTDLRNAGAKWVDQEVVTDQGLVTSRKPSDIPAFNRKLIEEIAEGVHRPRRAA